MIYLQLETRIMHYRKLSKQISHAVAQSTGFFTLTYFWCKIISNNYFIGKFFNVFFDIYLSYVTHLKKLKYSFVNIKRKQLLTKKLLLSVDNEVFLLNTGYPFFFN